MRRFFPLRLHAGGLLPAVSLAVLMLAGCSSRQTEAPIPPLHEVEAFVELIDVEVGGLTDDQRSRLREIVADNAELKERIIDQYAGRPLELQEAEKTRLKKLDRLVQGVLDDEQQDSWKPLFREVYSEEMDRYERGEMPEFSPSQRGGYGY